MNNEISLKNNLFIVFSKYFKKIYKKFFQKYYFLFIMLSFDSYSEIPDSETHEPIFYLHNKEGESKKVVRTQDEINILMNKIYYEEECPEFVKLTSYGKNEDHFKEIIEKVNNDEFDTGMDIVFARMGVPNNTNNLLLMSYFLLFDEIPKNFELD